MTIPRRIGLLAALAVTALGASAPAASAGEDESIFTKGGAVWFNHHGDWIIAADQRRDGMGVRAYLDWQDESGDNLAEITDVSGDDNDLASAPLVIPENTVVKLFMCYVDNGRIIRCSGTQRARA